MRFRIYKDIGGISWMYIAIGIIVLLPLIMFSLLYFKSMPVINEYGFWNLIVGSDWKPMSGKFGFLPFIVSSLWVSLIAMILSSLVCVLAAVYLTEYAPKWVMKIMQPVVDVLAGIPSVVYGVWGIIVVVPLVGKHIAPFFGTQSMGYSILAGGIVLAVMIIPFMLNILIELFKTVPIEAREAALSLGITRWQAIKIAVIKKTSGGIASAIGLGLARALGETIAVLMVVGNTVKLPDSIFSSGYPLPALIANNYGEMLSIPKYDNALMFAALVLMVIILFFNIIMRLIIMRYEKKYA